MDSTVRPACPGDTPCPRRPPGSTTREHRGPEGNRCPLGNPVDARASLTSQAKTKLRPLPPPVTSSPACFQVLEKNVEFGDPLRIKDIGAPKIPIIVNIFTAVYEVYWRSQHSPPLLAVQGIAASEATLYKGFGLEKFTKPSLNSVGRPLVFRDLGAALGAAWVPFPAIFMYYVNLNKILQSFS